MTGAKLSYRKITEKIAGKLKPLEAYLFYCLALNSDCYTFESHISQENLALFYGIKKTDQIRTWIHKFEELGFITITKDYHKGQFGNFYRCCYKLNTEHYIGISNQLYDEPISRELKGFLILFKCKCLNETNMCLYNQSRLAEELNLSESTISRYMNQAKELGYIKCDKKGMHLTNKKTFLIFKETIIAKVKGIYPNILTDEDIRDGYIHSPFSE